MAREIERLSTAKVRHAKPGLHPDGGGLYLQVTEGKEKRQLNKSWVFRFELAGKRREMGLGSLNTVSLAEARELAKAARQMVMNGDDPIEARKAEKASKQVAVAKSVTFEWCSVQYMAAHEAGWRNAKHRYQWTATLTNLAYPVIGKLPVDAIDTGLVMQILTPLWATKNETASRLRGRIEKILDWAKVHGHRSSGENPARWSGHLEHLLAPRKKVRKGGKQPALPWEDVPAFMRELRALPGIAPRALEFAIVTGARSGEVRGMPWSEISGDVWTVPGKRMKGGAEHRVPLTPRAKAILTEMEMMRLGEQVFPGDDGDGALSDMSLTAVIRRMNEARGRSRRPLWIDPQQDGRAVVPHGFRSSFRTWVQEATEFPDWMAEAALAHASGDKVEAAYKRGDALAKRRKLMEAWAAYCEGVTTTVVNPEVMAIAAA